jgi:integrase
MATGGKLTALAVTRAGKGKHGDGGGLYLYVHAGNSRSWVFRYGPQGRRELGLGPTHTVTLAEARERARECRKMLLDGIDPIAAKRQRKAAAKVDAARAATFTQCADQYFAAHRAGWRAAKHSAEWRSSLQQHVEPTIGALPVQVIDTALVLRALESIWVAKPVTAGRVRGRVEAVLDFAKARGLRNGENPARWRGHLENLLPKTKRVAQVKHFRALPYAAIAPFMTKLRTRDGVAARCLEFITLTAARLGEAVNAQWGEIDHSHKTWTVPAGRMKGGREHRVPLSSAAAAVLEEMAAIRKHDSSYVFPGARRGRPIGENTVWEMVKSVSGDEAATVHGLRSTFRDWAAERTNYPRELCELALAHVVAGEVERAYQRGDLFEKRRRLMTEWARFCSLPAAKAGDVVVMRRG